MKRGGPVIAVDGPAAAGKGTLAKRLAQALSLPYLDTGLLYRAVGRLALDAGQDPAAPAEAFAQKLSPEDLARTDLRAPEVAQAASKVAAQPAVRQALVETQRRFAGERGAVLDGRDIGTVIFPDADVKLFITASPATRALRRFLQLGGDQSAPNAQAQVAEMEEALKVRDAADSGRKTAPLQVAADAQVIETDTLSAEDVLAQALAFARRRLGQ
ncbi:cytidylate kinase [Acetobacter senegalensis]|uniref:Cytidylate kinase n=2 Tax=Acetobacter TaxID=434 RepID=A0A149TXZ5_9PROT|nr:MULTISPECIES: d(CMP) kinase [Acetobacter]ATJ90070.1 (d)CMP kinase [Acetobacter tropicalis]KXV51019.1 cytidylate kinase [Acetobacter tropicalis]KXV58095.1 cytidylate kinase [Acetobacter senegalensis]KXV61389.1 cytidylate kinase [Acetobacter tropicalis]MCG4272362.1 cytidylate kinase [Acetobacter senegalensis]